MGVIISALSLAIVHIAGDNVAVVPAMASLLGNGIYSTVLFAYMIFGSMVAGISAWIGVKSKHELTTVVSQLFGVRGKLMLALAILAVSLPASALTGGYFAGQLLQDLTGISSEWLVPVYIIICCILAADYGKELLYFSNYVALLLIPIIGIMLILLLDTNTTVSVSNVLTIDYISWPLVIALIGYNAGGMRSILIVETGTYFSHKNYTGVFLVVLAKIFEGFFTLLLAHIALLGGGSGVIPLSKIANQVFGSWLAIGFNSILVSILLNTMVPAMLVNAKQLSVITKLHFKHTLILAALLVWAGSLFSLELILMIMSVTGLFMIVFIGVVAYFLHKQRENKSK